MKLSEFMAGQKIGDAEFARLIGVGSRMAVLRYRRGERIPRPDVMRRIVEVTQGQVGPADFYDLPAGPSCEVTPAEAA